MSELSGRIQDSELEVMRVLWDAGEPLPLIQIRRVLSECVGWDDSTIKTLIRRLQSKGIVCLERRGVYSAIITEKEYTRWSTRRFVDKLFAGSGRRLAASMVSDGQLSEKDIAELSAIFNKGVQDE